MSNGTNQVYDSSGQRAATPPRQLTAPVSFGHSDKGVRIGLYVLVTLWPNGEAEIATRGNLKDAWSPPTILTDADESRPGL